MKDVPLYEVEHFTSIQQHLQPGMVAYDVGSHDGETSTFIAKVVGAENVVIIEPSEVNWPFIRDIYEDKPRATFPGFLGGNDLAGSEDRVYLRQFPPEAYEQKLLKRERLEFRWLHYRPVCKLTAARPMLQLDTLARLVGIPQGISIDVEGAELVVLYGADEVLREYHPLLWVSVHPKFMKERFSMTVEDLHQYLKRFRYQGTLLAAHCHEDYWLFS